MQVQQQGGTDGLGGLPVNSSLMSALKSQSVPTGSYGEMFTESGELRNHWKQFATLMEEIGNEEIARRWNHAQRLVRENGIAFAAWGDLEDVQRPWELDVLPLMIGSQEWDGVSAGLKQRAQLLEMTLADLHGPQDLIRTKVLPPEVIYGHAGFHPAFHGIPPSGGRYLHNYAADLGRAPDGSWWLLGDRCEAPSGSGYALENRVLTSRMLSEPFRACHVKRLAPYFSALQETCERVARVRLVDPRIVVLSQGPSSDRFFEDAYLSRYLGYTLVEGSDLTVRDRKVWLKTLGGLYPVHVIVRSATTSDCDPLENPTSSPAAVAGLVDAVRAGNVAITNPLGSGLVESPIFLAYSSRLCKSLLDQELILPSVATWWCGEPNACDYVLANLNKLVVKRAFRDRGKDQQIAETVRKWTEQELIERIRKHPAAYVAQERVVRSVMPNWDDGNVSMTYIALRAFLFADKSDYVVMDGGLVRTSKKLASLELSLLAGEGSKDAWVQGTEAPPQLSLLPSRHDPVTLRRSGSGLPSRVADNIFWLGRHVARADALARLIRAVAVRLTSESTESSDADLCILLRSLAHHGQIEPGFVIEGIKDRLPNIGNELPISTCDESMSGSIRSILTSTYRTASRVRDRISTDGWRILTRIDTRFRRTQDCDLTDLLNMSNELIADLAAFLGMVSESITRAQAFRFMELGFRIERAWQTVMLLINSFESSNTIDRRVLESLLEVNDSQMTYRYRYFSNLQVAPVLDLLVTDDSNPRSIVFQLLAIERHFEHLPRTEQATLSHEHRLLYNALHAVRMLDVESIGEKCELGDPKTLLAVLTDLKLSLPRLSEAISHKYFAHTGPAKLLSSFDQAIWDAT